MKNLKKLSAAFMLAALLSSSLTSCIDNEVSPLVEAIYGAQADLIAAQTTVQNAEATLLNARAEAEQALAAFREAQAIKELAWAANIDADTAHDIALWQEQLRKLIADNDNAIAIAAMDLEKAEAQFAIDMAALVAELAEAGALQAAGYATQYAAYMTKVYNSAESILTKQGAVAEKNLLIETGGLVTWEFYLEGLNADLAAAQAAVVAKTAEIAGYQDALDNPNARETQLADLQAQIADLDAEQLAYIVDIALAENVRQAAVDAKTAATDFMNPALVGAPGFVASPYAIALDGFDTWTAAHVADVDAIADKTDLIADLNDIIADYAGTETTLQGIIDAAVLRIGAAEEGPGAHASSHAAGFGLLGDIEILEDEKADLVTEKADLVTEKNNLITAMGTYGAAPIAADIPRAPSTVQNVLWNADLAIVHHDVAYAALTATYNAAAVALAGAADPSVAAGLLTTAQGNTATAVSDLAAAKLAYETAEGIFVLDPAGSQVSDGAPGIVPDLGELGKTDDVPTVSYQRVTAWAQLVATEFTPSALDPVAYTLAEITGAGGQGDILIADAGNTIGGDADVILWEQDGTSLDNAGAASIHGAGSTPNLTAAESFDATSNNVAYFLEVESDNSSTSNLKIFNVETNKYGLDDFASKDFTDNGLPYDGTNNWEPALIPTDANAGYLLAWDGSGIMGGPSDTLTAYAVMWNMNLAEAIAQYNADTAQGDYDDLEQDYLDQKALFDEGLETRNGVGGLVEAAATAQDDIDTAQGVVNDKQTEINDKQTEINTKQGEIDDLEDELGGTEWIEVGPAGVGQVVRTVNTAGNLILSWNVHANDGLDIGDETHDYNAAAEWDSTDDGDADSNTAYAELWNAQNALAIHIDTPLTGAAGSYTEQLATATEDLNDATLEAAEDLLMIAQYQADLDALQAQYDALLLTPEYAALTIAVLDATAAKNALEAANGASEAMEAALELVVTSLVGVVDDPLTLLIDETVLGYDFPDWAALIATAETALATLIEDVEEAEVLIAKGEVDLQDVHDAIAQLEADIAELEAQMAVDQALADEYKALLDAALAS